VNLASRGLRDMDGGPEAVTDETEKARVREQATRVHMKSVLTALAVAAVVTVVRR
jgi:hypothetical protein